MNTRAVAKLLGISVSTVQRWIKQLDLEMERNELGHFIFSDEDIELLKEVKMQLQQGKILQEIEIGSNSKRILPMKIEQSDEQLNRITDKIKEIEMNMNQKADSVVSYQLLQHRREIEELQEQIAVLTEKIVSIETLVEKERETAAAHEMIKQSSRKKNKFFQAIFG
nr:MerR family transcriptional regulator [uncultured Bacillus sp.]